LDKPPAPPDLEHSPTRADGPLAAGLAALAAALAFAYYAHRPLNHDCAWFLDITRRFLDGARLYRDVLEINPPLAVYLTVPVVAAGRATAFGPKSLFVAYVALLSGLSALAFWAVLRRTGLPRPVVWAGFAGALFAGLVAPNGTFGQREHLALVLTLPYVALAFLRSEGRTGDRPLALAVGIAAGLGFCLKPYFLIAPAALELWLVWMRGTWRSLARPEAVALAATGLLYAASIPLLTPDYLRIMVPLGRAVYDSGYRAPLLEQVLVVFPHLVLLAAVYGILAAREARAAARLIAALGIGAAGFLAAYFVQGKAYAYHRVPGFGFLIVLSFVAAAIFLRPPRVSRIPRVGRLALGAAALGLPFLLIQPRYVNEFLKPGRALLARHPAGPVYVLSSRFPAAYPLLAETGRSASSFPCLWPLPGLFQERRTDPNPKEAARLAWVERFVTDTVVRDFERKRPALVLVDDGALDPPGFPSGFDALAFLRQDPRFARIWAGYAEADRRGPYVAYVLVGAS
jgi:hypothetical protein